MATKMPDRLGLAELLKPSGPWERQGCPCGTGERYFGEGPGARARHADWHLAWDRGVALPSGVPWWDSLAIVRDDSSKKERDVAYKLARIFQREERYDFPLLPDPKYWATRDRLPTAYIAVYHQRAIGLICGHSATQWADWDPSSPGCTFDVLEPLPLIAGIFVCRSYRRRGVATALIQAMAEDAAMPARHLVWGPPFSDAGKALALSIVGDRTLRVGR